MKKVFVLLALGTTMVACGPANFDEMKTEWTKECTTKEELVKLFGKDKVGGFCDCVFDKLKADAKDDFGKMKDLMKDENAVKKVAENCTLSSM